MRCTSMKWFPEPIVPTCPDPRRRARSDTAPGSAPGRQPSDSVRSRSSSVPMPRSRTRSAGPSSSSRSRPAPSKCSAPRLPAPAGIAREISWTSGSTRRPSSLASSGSASSRTPQLMSYPTPPGETTPSGSSVAATPPTGKPYPWWMSGIASAASTIPGSMATFCSCSSDRSPRIASSSTSSANTRAGTRMPGHADAGISQSVGPRRCSTDCAAAGDKAVTHASFDPHQHRSGWAPPHRYLPTPADRIRAFPDASARRRGEARGEVGTA